MQMEWIVVRYRDGREIHKGSKYRMEADDGTAALTVFDVDNNDVGLYRCELYNQHGRAETSASLTVNGQQPTVYCSSKQLR